MMRDGKTICFSRLDELPQEAMVDLEYLQSRGVKSLLFIPIQIKNRTATVLAFSGIRSEYLWPEKLKPRLHLLAEVFTSVLKQKQTEEAILQEKHFTETVINSLPGIFYLYDSDWRMVHWNLNHELLTGFSADELKGRMVLDWFSEDCKGTVASAIRKVFDEGEAMIEAPLTIKGDRQVPYLFKGVRLEVAGEVYFMGMGIDISQRKDNEEALKRNEQQLRLITDSLPALISHVDSNQRYIFVNESYAKFVGQPRELIYGKHVREVVGENTYEGIREHIEMVLSGQPITFEITVQLSGSELRHMLAMYVPDIRNNKTQGFFASIHDVTDLEKAKKQAQAANEALYHVGRVTMLEAISSSLSHEMQQPLTGVLSNAQAAEMLLNNPKPDMDEIQVIIKDIIADVKRAGEVMRQLRAFLRKQETNVQILNFNCLIEEVLRVLNSDIVIHKVKVVRNLADDLPQIMGDSVQLKQVLINLILNAQQAMEDSTSNVYRLTIHTSVGRENKINVSIEDSGPGIEEIKLEHIFEPFYTTRSRGTGMGLAISRFIIEAHGGRIWAENRNEGGARFCLSLPVPKGGSES
jgi:PAS domain S-box-containing protein